MKIRIINKERAGFPIPQKKLQAIATKASRIFRIPKTAIIDVVFSTSGESKRLNKQFRNQSYVPDVLTFSYGKKEKVIGEIFVVSKVIQVQAKERGHRLVDEFTILLIHGIIHMMGFEHVGVSASAKKAMKAKEAMLLKVANLAMDDRGY